MDAELTSIARSCLNAAHDGSLSFPEIVGRLIAAGFEGYEVNYRRACQTFYLPSGDSVELPISLASGAIAVRFDALQVGQLVRWAQANPPDYSYGAFCDRVRQAGCAGYLVSFLGKRVLYFGRTAETHVELFPS